MHTSFKKHTDILPHFESLTCTTDFHTLLVPSNDQCMGYTTIKSIYNWYSDSIYNILMDVDTINSKRTPKAHKMVITYRHTNDGWKLLFHFLTKLCPFLGGKMMDIDSETTLLKLYNTDTIHTFF